MNAFTGISPTLSQTLLRIFTIFRSGKFLVPFVLIGMSLGGCQFYRASLLTDPNSKHFIELKNEHRYFIVHLDTHVYNLHSISIKDSFIEGKVADLPDYQNIYKKTARKGINRYKSSQRQLITQVHIYPYIFAPVSEEIIRIYYKDIAKIEVFEHEENLTSATHYFAYSAVVFIISATYFIILLLGII